MRKTFLLWILAMAMLASGCAGRNTNIPQTTAATTGETTVTTEAETAPTIQTEPPETTQAQQTEATNPGDSLDDDLADLKAQSDIIKKSLQQDSLTQAEMNRAAQSLYELWDGALNDLWAELQDRLPDEAFDELLDAQLTWIEDKESAVEAAGKDYEGGSLYPLVTSQEAARITEDRVYELFELLKSSLS